MYLKALILLWETIRQYICSMYFECFQSFSGSMEPFYKKDIINIIKPIIKLRSFRQQAIKAAQVRKDTEIANVTWWALAK